MYPRLIDRPFRTTTAGAAALMAVGLGFAGAPTAHADSLATAMVSTQRQTAPTLNSTQVGWYAKGQRVNLTCYQRGQGVTGYYSPWIPGRVDNLWYKASDGYWVADVDINTGSNNPVTAACPATTPPSTNSTGPFNAGIIAAAQRRGTGSYGGQCLVFAENMVRAAGGPSIAMGYNVSTYQSQWSRYANEVSWSNARPGDIIQWYDPAGRYGPVHTAILTGGNNESTATVVDSNYGIPFNQERVSRGSFSSRNAGFHPHTYRIWRIHR
ncbi:MAG TPA: CHAP domain-containing protein [Candidatus Luteococcus avicola]|nr:CHAP domain-containing protein [Candidatus Luteococcus avicola]